MSRRTMMQNDTAMQFFFVPLTCILMSCLRFAGPQGTLCLSVRMDLQYQLATTVRLMLLEFCGIVLCVVEVTQGEHMTLGTNIMQ